MKMVFANVKIDGFQRRFFTIRYKRFDFKRFGFPIKIRIIKNFVIKFKDETKKMKKNKLFQVTKHVLFLLHPFYF
jgi:hypothetical protein